MRGLLSLATLGAGLALTGPAAAADQPIAFADYAYSPPTASITVNDTATFSGDFNRHPLVWSDGSVDPGAKRPDRISSRNRSATASITFDRTIGSKGAVSMTGSTS